MAVWALVRKELVAAKISCRTLEFTDTERGRTLFSFFLERLAGDMVFEVEDGGAIALFVGLRDRCITKMCVLFFVRKIF